MKTSFQLLVGLLFVAVAVADAAEESRRILITPEYLTQLSEQMRSNHPVVRAYVHRARGAAAGARAVRTWEDPMAKVGGMAARRMMREEDGDVLVGVEQMLPLFGKAQAERRMAEAEASMEERKVDLQFQTLRRDLAKTIFRAALAERALELSHSDLAWLDTLVKSAESKYESRTASLAEVLQLRNERARRFNLLKRDEARLQHEQVAINRFLGRETTAAWPRHELPPPATEVIYSQRLVDLALKAEPKLAVMRQELQQGHASVIVAKRQRLPDFTLGAEGRGYSRNADFSSAEVMLSFNIPWGNRGKYREQLRREEEKARATELEIENEEQALREEVHQLTIMIENARREAVLYRDEIIPRSRTALEAAHSAWQAGGGMLRDVIETRRMLTEADLMFARAVTEQYEAMSELVLCCGLGDFEALQMIGVR